MERPGTAELWASLAGQWPVLGVDPGSAGRIRERARRLGLPPAGVTLVDWAGSLFLFVAPLLALVLFRPGPHGTGRMVAFLGLGGLAFVTLQRGVRFLGLLLLRSLLPQGRS